MSWIVRYLLFHGTRISDLGAATAIDDCGRIPVLEFPPARIFMGDAGSGFLGVILGSLSIQAAWAGSEFFLPG